MPDSGELQKRKMLSVARSDATGATIVSLNLSLVQTILAITGAISGTCAVLFGLVWTLVKLAIIPIIAAQITMDQKTQDERNDRTYVTQVAFSNYVGEKNAMWKDQAATNVEVKDALKTIQDDIKELLRRGGRSQ